MKKASLVALLLVFIFSLLVFSFFVNAKILFAQALPDLQPISASMCYTKNPTYFWIYQPGDPNTEYMNADFRLIVTVRNNGPASAGSTISKHYAWVGDDYYLKTISPPNVPLLNPKQTITLTYYFNATCYRRSGNCAYIVNHNQGTSGVDYIRESNYANNWYSLSNYDHPCSNKRCYWDGERKVCLPPPKAF